MATNKNQQNFFNESSVNRNDDDDCNDNDNEQNIQVMSVSWQKSYLACCYYKLLTMELYITYEALDSSPEFPFLRNLFRYVTPQYIVSCGSIIFLNAVMRNFGLKSEDISLENYRIGKNRRLPTTNFVIYPNDEKTIKMNYEKIIKMHLPGMDYNITDEKRRILIGSILPLQQTQVILCIGNIMHFIENRWKHYALNMNQNYGLKITDLKVFLLQSQVLISNGTILSFQIFSNLYHPAGFMKGLKSSTKEGFSIYGLFNKCRSRIGSKTLHSLLSQPIRNECELNISLTTIDWYIQEQNRDKWQILGRHLRNIRDISETFRNITLKSDNIKYWRILKQTVYNAYLIMRFCQGIVNENSNRTVIEQLANKLVEEDKQLLQDILYTLNAIVDLEEGYCQNKFVVKEGFDTDLDNKKSKMIEIQDELQETVREQVKSIPELYSENILGYYIPEVGYVIKMEITQNHGNNIIEHLLNTNLSLLLKTDNAYYLTSAFCENLNKKYGDIYTEICEHELRICNRLKKYLNENLLAVQEVVKLCIKLDYMMSFATVSIERCLTRPQIVNDNDDNNSKKKIINIIQGRHILWETKETFISNDTEISSDNHNLVTILIAPNASGKSVYMKQVGIIAYLTHTGCFIPAKSAKISLLDSIHSQMYSGESIHEATSSFLFDLQQMTHIMNTATGKSLVLIDEFGKGTTDIEGQALLVACIEDFLKRQNDCPIIIISTHYIDIINLLKSKENINIKTIECEIKDNGEVISTFKLKDVTNFDSLKSLATVDRIKILLQKIFGSENEKLHNSNEWNQIYTKKISFIYTILEEYLKTNQINGRQIFQNFNDLEF